MNYLDTDITNPFFAGYAMDCDREFEARINSILARNGESLAASKLTEELQKEGISVESLSPGDTALIDATFDVY